MAGSIYELAILLSLKDMASGGLNRHEAHLRSLGKEGKATLKIYQDMRASMQRDFVVAGTGVASLMLLKKGMDFAGDYESALLDIRSAYQETAAAGALSAQEQETQLKGLGALAVDLGNKLQGNTQDYVGILSALKQAGLPGDQVLGGAGRSAAYLANVSGALLRGQAREQAKELGQFGLMFKLRPEEFETSVNLFSALKDKFDIESSSLIESAKYFQATSNQLGISGAKGAGETVKFFALLKRNAGMEGSMAGTGARAFFMQLATEEKKIAALKKATGIELKPFDEKGMFRGYDAMFSEMEKFRALNQQESAKWLNNIFGERGQEVASAMVKVGLDGWKNITAESAKAVPVNQKIEQQMATYNAKVEALTGSIQNLTASAFLPALETAKPLVDTLNTGVSALQGWAASHPGVAGVGVQLFGVASIATTVIFGLKGAVTAVRLWQIASSVSVGQTGQLTFMRALGAQSVATGVQLEGAAGKAGRLKGMLGGFPAQIGVTIALTYTIAKGFEYYQAMQEYKTANAGVTNAGAVSLNSLARLREDYAKRGEEVPRSVYEARAGDMMRAGREQGVFDAGMLGGGGDLAGRQRHFLNPYGVFYPETNFVKQNPELADSRLMKAFLDKLNTAALGGNPVESGIIAERARKSLEQAFPESFKKAVEDGATSAGNLNKSFVEMATPVDRTRGIFSSLNFSLLGFQSQLNNWTPPQFGPPEAPRTVPQFGLPSTGAPFKAEKTSLVSQGGGGSRTVHVGGITVNVPAGARAADDPQELARLVAYELEIQSERA